MDDDGERRESILCWNLDPLDLTLASRRGCLDGHDRYQRGRDGEDWDQLSHDGLPLLLMGAP
jgi:hypothetical protein